MMKVSLYKKEKDFKRFAGLFAWRKYPTIKEAWQDYTP